MLSKTTMSSVIYAFKDYNVFSHLHFQRLQCLQSFTLSKTTISSAIYAFKDYNIFSHLRFQRPQCLWFYDSKTTMSLALWFIRLQCLLFYIVFKDFDVFCFIFHRTQCPRLFFIGLNVLFFEFLRTQRPLFLCFQKTSSVFRFYALRDFNALHFTFYRTSRSSVWCYRTSMSFFSILFLLFSLVFDFWIARSLIWN